MTETRMKACIGSIDREANIIATARFAAEELFRKFWPFADVIPQLVIHFLDQK